MKRVVAYCRVSTDHADQVNSLDAQKRYFTEYINRSNDMQLICVYADEGISGTSTKKRKQFNQMIADAENDKFDLILTKEVSRFARNTLDTLQYVRLLKRLNIGVSFLNDNINTLDKDAELRLTIMASIAQEESRKTSERVKWGIKRSMERGVAFGNHLFGYNIKNGKLTVNEKEADTVRLIFDLYVNGMSTYAISKEMEKRGILSPMGLTRWKNVSIAHILANEKYVGTLKQRKEITIDFLEHKKVKNTGQEEYIVAESNHEPIVCLDVFEKAQEELQKRKKVVEDGSKYSNRYCFSCKIVCGLCGAKFQRRYWNGKHEQRNVVWQCANNARWGQKKLNAYGEYSGCDSRGIHEDVLFQAFNNALSTMLVDKDSLIKEIIFSVKQAVESQTDNTHKIANIQTSIEKLKRRRTTLIELLADKQIDKQEFEDTNQQYKKELDSLNLSLLELIEQDKTHNLLTERLSNISSIVHKLVALASPLDFSDSVCNELLDRVEVYSRDKICFFLRLTDDYCLSIPISNENQVLANRKRYNHNATQFQNLYKDLKVNVYLEI